MKQIAIIGPTASGKTSLSIQLANNNNAYILSLDSLAIYKEIDIASAKPTQEELNNTPHFGVNLLYPNDSFDVVTYIDLYKEVYKKCQQDNKNLIIIGGTSFYLKSLLQGISPLPNISKESKDKTKHALSSLKYSYQMLRDKDPVYMNTIKPTDKYRIEKMLDIFYQTNLTPTEYFSLHKPKPTITEPLTIYQVSIPKESIHSNIQLRTKQMLEDGLIDEVSYLEKKYTRTPNPMKAIGIRETLEFLDGLYSIDALFDKIVTNTKRLAKRQNTFNSSQFTDTTTGTTKNLYKIITDSF